MPLSSSLQTAHYRALAALWTIGIMLAVTIPTGGVPDVHSPLGFDKVVHAILFLGFGLLWLRGLCPPEQVATSIVPSERSLFLLGVGVVFAMSTEIYQYVLPLERLADPYDAVADLVGLFVAFVGYHVYAHRSRAPRG